VRDAGFSLHRARLRGLRAVRFSAMVVMDAGLFTGEQRMSEASQAVRDFGE